MRGISLLLMMIVFCMVEDSGAQMFSEQDIHFFVFTVEGSYSFQPSD